MFDFPAPNRHTTMPAARAEHSQPEPAPPAGSPSPQLPDAQAFRRTLEACGISLHEPQQERLLQYCHLLWEWNQRLNLTRHTTYEKFVSRDVVDSLAFARHLDQGEQVLDVGTGGGVPGVILAIVRPDLRLTLVDSTAKKVRAVQDICRRLGLQLPVRHQKAQRLLEQGEAFDTLVIRAVARLDVLLEWFNPYWGAFQRMLVLKGPRWLEERKKARERRLILHLELRRLETYPTPGTGAENVLLQLRPKQPK